MEFLLPAFMLGILGSFHCIGMCGPIAMALPLKSASSTERIIKALAYNAGRILTYSMFGLVFGIIGKSVVIAGYQQALSIVLGVAVLVMYFLPTSTTSRIPVMKYATRLISKLKAAFGIMLQKKSLSSTFVLGMLNGLLPCGLVYLAVAGSIATGDMLKGAAFMALFGLGTLPAMAFVTTASQWISVSVRAKMRTLIPVFVVVSSCLLIVRGMNLGIPYLSPQFSNTDCTKHSCCHKVSSTQMP